MPELFIGAEVRAGNFTDEKTGKSVAYNNLIMTFATPGNVGFVINPQNPTVKVKNTREDIFRVFGEMITMKWLKEHLNHYADVFYDERKRVARIQFYGTENPFADNGGLSPAMTASEGISDYTHTDTPAAPLGQLEEKLDELAKLPSEEAAEKVAFEKEAADGADKKGGKR